MRIFILFVIFSSISLFSCEDDPIIEPTSGSTKSGSYARLSFPDSTQFSNSPNK